MSYHRCGSGTGQYYVAKVGNGAGTYNISAIYDDYASLTANNFIVTSQAIGGANTNSYSPGWDTQSGHGSTSYARPNKTYNQSNGILTVAERRADSGTDVPGVGGYVKAQPEDIYLVVGL